MQTTAQLGDKLKAWDIAGPLALVGTIALLSGGMKWHASGFNADTAVPLGLGALLLVLAAPALLARAGLANPKTSLRYGATGLAALALGAGAYGVQKNGAPGVPSLGSLSKITLLPRGAPPVEGRASVVAADTLRVNGTLYRLTGIEAPEKAQSCTKEGKRRWRCGEAAVAGLEKRARSKVVRCTPSAAADAEGRVPATCTVDGADIAAELVRGGLVFAAPTMFGGYSSEEGEAKKAAAGLWSGDAERPAAYRAKLWDDARKSAPEGCPIKAVSVSGTKVYLLPWSSGYKKASVKAAKGERWFCTESEAAGAGYRPDRT